MNFDFSSLRLPSTFDQSLMTKKIITTIPLRKPRPGLDFFRIRPESEWTFPTLLLYLKNGEEEKYLIAPELVPEVFDTGRLKPVTIYTGITFNGQVLFLSDIPNPNSEGKDNDYHKSRRIAYEMAKSKWIKIQVNKALGAYEIIEAQSQLPEPIWPDDPADITKAIEICFKNNLIDSADHSALKGLRGAL